MKHTSSYSKQVRYTQKLLTEELLRRKEKNPGYSLRAFAKSLGISAGRLSEYLSGTRLISTKVIDSIGTSLRLSTKECDFWKACVAEEKVKSKQGIKYHEIKSHELELLADWPHFALIALIKTEGFKSQIPWIAKRLKISHEQTQRTIFNLESAGFLDRSVEPWRVLHGAASTGHEMASQWIRHSHRQYLSQAENSLDQVDLLLRDVTSICMAIDPKKLPQAKRKIAKFRRDLCAYLGKGKLTEVYRLNIQLFPTSFPTESQD